MTAPEDPNGLREALARDIGAKRLTPRQIENGCTWENAHPVWKKLMRKEADQFLAEPGAVFLAASLRAAEAEITRLKEGMEGLGAALKPFCFGDPTLENILFGNMPDDATCTLTVKLRDTRRAQTALATLSPKEQP